MSREGDRAGICGSFQTGFMQSTLVTKDREEAKTESKGIPVASLIGVGAAGFSAFLNLNATQPILPMLLAAFDATKASVSLTVSMPALGVALAAPFIGLFSDKIGRKRVIVPAMFLLTLPTFLAGCSGNLNELIFWRFIQGLILPAIFAVAMTYVGEEWEYGGLGQAMATYAAGNVLGGITGRLISGIVAAHFGWRDVFYVLALANVLAAVTAWVLLPRSRHFIKHRHHLSYSQTIRGHLSNKELLCVFLLGGNMMFAGMATFTYVIFHLSNPPYSLSTVALSWIFTISLVGAFILPHAGRLMDKFGMRPTMMVTITISAMGLMLTLLPNIFCVIAGMTISSTALLISQSATTSSLKQFTRYGNSSASGLYVFFYYIGGCLGGALPGMMGAASTWAGCVALVLLGHVFALLLAASLWFSNDRVVPVIRKRDA
jgi:MFS transporter, YNFM family, putative membrane transport protein